MDYTINWSVVAPIVVAIATVITLLLKKYEIVSLRRKHFGDRLTSSIQYFENFYEGKTYNQLVLDRASHELAQCRFVDANLVNRLIEYHQNFLVDFDEMVNHADLGEDHINFKKSKALDITLDITFKKSKIIPFKSRQVLCYAGYFAFSCLTFYFGYNTVISDSFLQWAPYAIFTVWAFCMAFSCLMLEDKLKNANQFVTKLHKAESIFKDMPKKRSIIIPNQQNNIY